MHTCTQVGTHVHMACTLTVLKEVLGQNAGLGFPALPGRKILESRLEPPLITRGVTFILRGPCKKALHSVSTESSRNAV